MWTVCAVEGISAPGGPSGFHADSDSSLFCIDLNQMDISNSRLSEMHSRQGPREKGVGLLNNKPISATQSTSDAA